MSSHHAPGGRFAARVGKGAPADAAPRPAALRYRLAIISRHRLYRDALVATFARVPALQLAGVLTPEAAAGCATAFDVAILDARLGADGAALVERLRSRQPRLRVIVLGTVREDTAGWAGVRGASHVDADGSAADIMVAVLHAARVASTPSPALAGLALPGSLPAPAARCARAEANLLTPREQAVLGMAAEGLANKEIARCLGISGCTVKNHMHNVLDKMGARRRGEAVARFRREAAAAAGFDAAGRQPARPSGIAG